MGEVRKISQGEVRLLAQAGSVAAATTSLHVLDQLPIALCLVSGRVILHANTAFEALLGYPVADVAGCPIDSLSCRSDREIMSSAAPQPLRHASGRATWLLVRVGETDRNGFSLWTFEDGSVVRGLRQDLIRVRSRVGGEIDRRTTRVRETNLEYRRELERLRVFDVGLTQSREKYRVLFQNSQTGIVFVDDDGSISQINPAMQMLLKARNMVEFRRIVLRPIFRCEGFPDPVLLTEIARHLVLEVIGEQTRLISVALPDDEVRWIEVKCTRMHVRDYSAALTFTNRTEEVLTRRREAEQRRQINRLGRISLAGHLGSAAAHELGQPLNVCMSYVGGLRQRIDSGEAGEEQIRHALSKIEAELCRASAVLRNMRQFVANHDAGDRQVSLVHLIHDTVELMSSNMRDAGASVVLDLPDDDDLFFCGSAVEIQQVLVNLILNALDSMRESVIAQPRISVDAKLNELGQIRCEVHDSGPGIAPEIQEFLFTPYRTNKADGLGLGLAMSRNIVESHGGQMCAVSPIRGGAIFGFTLPAAVEGHRA